MSKTNKRKLTRFLGPVGKVMDILPETTEIINKTIEKAAPIIDKELESRRENRKLYRDIPKVLELDVNRGKEILEEVGFVTEVLLAKPAKKYQDKRSGEIVGLSLKGKTAKLGTLIKVYYVDEQVIADSRKRALPNLLGMQVEEAKELLLAEDLQPILKVIPPHKKYALLQPGTIVDANPKLDLFHKVVAPGTRVQLFYVNEQTILQSQQLLEKKEPVKKEKMPKTNKKLFKREK